MSNSKRKTYGVHGMMEWLCVIPCGKAKMEVHFTGGTLSGYGIVPAQFITENPITQAVIENSEYYKSGKITLMSETKGSGKFKLVEKKDPAPQAYFPGAAATASIIAETPLNPDFNHGNAPVDQESGMKTVDVTDLEEARNYIHETFGIPNSQLRSMVAVKEAAKSNNIEFRGI